MNLIKRVALNWKRRQILLEIEKLIIQVYNKPELLNRLYELELMLKSIDEQLIG